MKYNAEFVEELRQLDTMILLQKEYELLLHKKSHLKKMLVIHYDHVYYPEVERMYEDVLQELKLVEAKMAPHQNTLNKPHLIISRYMKLYQVSIQSVSRLLRVQPQIIEDYLKRNQIVPETKAFIFWAMRNFRLDANRYWDLIAE